MEHTKKYVTVSKLNERLARCVEKHRESKGMTLSELSRKAKLSFITVHRIERGWRDTRHVPNFKTIARLSRAFNIEPSELIR